MVPTEEINFSFFIIGIFQSSTCFTLFPHHFSSGGPHLTYFFLNLIIVGGCVSYYCVGCVSFFLVNVVV